MTEASLAWQYEEEHEKNEILEQYLNTVYFGANAYGIEAAARTYYDKEAVDLSLPESALLVGIINLPGTYDPFNESESARKRRDIVLDRMLEHGYVIPEEHAGAIAEDLNLSRGQVEPESENEYFLDAVRKELAEQYGDRALYEGGLKIYTTLDPRCRNSRWWRWIRSWIPRRVTLRRPWSPWSLPRARSRRSLGARTSSR
jgi:penicillin-binding protein 1A